MLLSVFIRFIRGLIFLYFPFFVLVRVFRGLFLLFFSSSFLPLSSPVFPVFPVVYSFPYLLFQAAYSVQ